MDSYGETLASKRYLRRLTVTLGLALTVAACGGDSTTSAQLQRAPAVLPASAAAVPVPLEVPPSLSATPLDTPRSILVPPGFGMRVWARIEKARFMALAPNGDVLVSVPSQGKIVLLRNRPDGTPEAFDYATGLQNPHDMVFHRIGDTTYLYVAESNRITRSVYQSGETTTGVRGTVVANLPDNSTPELRGAYGHQLKNIALSPDNKLYVSIASACNACVEDTVSNPVRGAIYQYNADGTEGRLFAQGLRNAEGLDILPGTNTLWVTVNNRDEVYFPIQYDWTGDGQSDYGKLLPSYVDVNPLEPFTAVRDGGNYGWPFCNPTGNATMSNLDLFPDYELNPSSSVLNCATMDRSSKAIRAHAAPLGFSFLHNSNVPVDYRRGAVVAQHGCWNCTTLMAGYRVSYFPFDEAGNAGSEMDLVTGFVTDPVKRDFWGRPVDAIADANGNILISDDYANAIYQLYPRP